jgi:alpha-tubulin suppressor-like RCC1 family protein
MQMSTLEEARKRIAKYQGCISAGSTSSCTIGLKTDGTVLAIGKNDVCQCNTQGWHDIVSVSASGVYTVGLKSDGTVIVVGKNIYGESNIQGWRDIISVYAGPCIFGLKSDSTVVVGVYSGPTQSWLRPDWLQGCRNISAISSGMMHIVGLKTDGTVFTSIISQTDFTLVAMRENSGLNTQGWHDIVAISAALFHTVGLKSDGTVVVVGDDKSGNTFGQCNTQDWRDIVAISAGGGHTVGLKSDGTVVAVGFNKFGQCNTQDWCDIVAISAGECHTVGLKSNGTVVVTGNNEFGQCNTQDWHGIGPADMKLIEHHREQERIERERLRVEAEAKAAERARAEAEAAAERWRKSKPWVLGIGLGLLLLLVAIVMISGNNKDAGKTPVVTIEKAEPNSLEAIRTGLQASGKTRLVIETAKKPSYSLAYSEKQLQITLKNMQGEAKPSVGSKTLVSNITSSQSDDSIVISVSLTRSINEIPEEQAVILEPGENNKNFRLVLDFEAVKSR